MHTFYSVIMDGESNSMDELGGCGSMQF